MGNSVKYNYYMCNWCGRINKIDSEKVEHIEDGLVLGYCKSSKDECLYGDDGVIGMTPIEGEKYGN